MYIYLDPIGGTGNKCQKSSFYRENKSQSRSPSGGTTSLFRGTTVKNQRKTRGNSIASYCNRPTSEQIFAAATAYVASGLSIIPIQPGGEKNPAWRLLPSIYSEGAGRDKHTWKPFQKRLPTNTELCEWFLGTHGNNPGMAAIAGTISGNLEILDLDSFDVVEPWRKAVEKKMPGLVDRLVRVVTPRPGLHVYYRCEVIGGCEKLARVAEKDANGKLRPKAIAETKGEGGYCLCPPSPADCHQKNTCYRFEDEKDLTMIPTITPEERDVLLSAARGLNTWEEPPRPAKKPVQQDPLDIGTRPGDDFNRRADWPEILTPHGWHLLYEDADGTENWSRPGKDFGTSATVNYLGLDLLHVFSCNADPFEPETSYNKFSVYALLEHDGDFTAAAQHLASLGYGENPFANFRIRSKGSNSGTNPYEGFTSRSRSIVR